MGICCADVVDAYGSLLYHAVGLYGTLVITNDILARAYRLGWFIHRYRCVLLGDGSGMSADVVQSLSDDHTSHEHIELSH